MDKWFPNVWEVRTRRSSSDNYLRGLWVSFTAVILNFPKDLLSVMFHGRLTDLIKFVICAFIAVFVFPIFGLFGAIDIRKDRV